MALGLLPLTLITTCAWNESRLKQTESDYDLVSRIENENETLHKFKTPKLALEEDSSKNKQEINSQKKMKNYQQNGQKGPKLHQKKWPQTDRQKLKGSQKKSSLNQEGTKEKKKRISDPKDYPEAFKTYDQQSVKVWKEFRPMIFIGEEMTFDVKYFGVTAGKVILKTLPPTEIAYQKANHFYAKMVSAPFYSYIYELDDYISTYVSTAGLRPIKYTLIQRESKQKVEDLQIFDQETLKTYLWYKKDKKGKVREEKKTAFYPRYSLDSLSALFFIRGLPLVPGKSYEIPIVTRAKVWILTFKTIGEETLKLGRKAYRAIKIKAETRFPGVLKKKGDISFWYSADKLRRVLKFEAKVKIGEIYGELVDYTPGEIRP